MKLDEIRNIAVEAEQVQKIYEVFDENSRLNRSKSARVEFLTTTRYIERYLKPGDRILDVGAGAGEYSLYFARKGHEVCALELAEYNLKAFEAKLTPEDNVRLVQGNAMDLSRYEDGSFDVCCSLARFTICMGRRTNSGVLRRPDGCASRWANSFLRLSPMML